MQQVFNHQMPQHPLYIFDLDGTLALIEHRRHMVEDVPCQGCSATGLDDVNGNRCNACNGKRKVARKLTREDWLAFYLACDRDQPNWPVIGTMLQLYASGNDVRIWSGRGAEARGKTLMWLHAWTRIPLITLERIVLMRPEADTTPDHQLKKAWYNKLSPQEKQRLCAVFDDRKKVVDMWREMGIACFQVAEGNF